MGSPARYDERWGAGSEAGEMVSPPYDQLFLRRDGLDMRKLPMVTHPVTGKKHFDHGGWPRQVSETETGQ